MRYLIHRGGPLATAWRPVVLLAVLGLTTACREDDPLPTGPRVSGPSGPLVSIGGASLTGLPFVGVAINDAGQVGDRHAERGAGSLPNHRRRRQRKPRPTRRCDPRRALGREGGDASVRHPVGCAARRAGHHARGRRQHPRYDRALMRRRATAARHQTPATIRKGSDDNTSAKGPNEALGFASTCAVS